MAKRLVEKILIEEESTDTMKVYKKVWEEVPDVKPSPAKPKAKKAPVAKPKVKKAPVKKSK